MTNDTIWVVEYKRDFGYKANIWRFSLAMFLTREEARLRKAELCRTAPKGVKYRVAKYVREDTPLWRGGR